jgi:hypothetical protein
MQNFFTKTSYLNTPILFIVFNRPDVTAKVFETIKKTKPRRLYVAADGPRQDEINDIERVAKVRKIATAVDWPCEVKTLFREKNLGCKYGCSTAISWFFEHEEQGIILEDDCFPHQDFFYFCQTLLYYYLNENKILAITGDNFQNNHKRGKASYYFSKYFHCWGWATWRRAWQYYDSEIKFWPDWKNSSDWKNKLPDKVERRYWKNIFDLVYKKKIDTWDYSFTASILKKRGLVATPNVNLVSNIGFDQDGTHVKIFDEKIASLPIEALTEFYHPKKIEQDYKADIYIFDYHYGGRNLRMPFLLLYLSIKILKYFFLFFSNIVNKIKKNNFKY